MKKSIIFFVFIFFIQIKSYSQKIEKWCVTKINLIETVPFDYSKNILINNNKMNLFLEKLYKNKHLSNEKAVIVHIGDSHIQADMMTSVIRNSFQNYFGNAGRGLIFPYQVAKSNAPTDLISNSASYWKGTRITKNISKSSCGISAYGLESQNNNPEFNFELRSINGIKDNFDKISFFLKGNASELQYNGDKQENVNFETDGDFCVLNLKSMTSGFKLSFTTKDTVLFYGASLEKNNASGIIYHSIGANGAKYFDYNKTPLFWKQLGKLNADCYIISLATNEAQDQNITAEGFIKSIKEMLNNIKMVSPNACVILTTPPVSYFKKLKPNPSLKTITDAIIIYCNENDITYWDLFNVSNGLDGAKKWKAMQLLRPDLVHFSKKGYVLQGELFLDAFSKVWNEFLLDKATIQPIN